jgi:ABC-2 type transport system ATP-binding protein
MTEAVLSIEHLTRRYGDRTAIQDLNLCVYAGQTVGFLGPNGAGKTTTIRILLGLIRPDSGRALIAGADTWREHVRAARHFGAVLETTAFYDYLSGRENLRQFARAGGLASETELATLLERVDLGDRADDRVAHYSNGMRQRLALAQALLGRPSLLILDEPLNGLDPAGIHEVRGLIRELSNDGMAVFLSSHQLSEVQSLCERIAVIHHGFLRIEGSLADLTKFHHDELAIAVSDPARARVVLGAMTEVTLMDDGEEAERLDIVRVSTAEGLAGEVTRRLVTAGVDVREMHRVRRSLEDVFLELTDLKDSAEGAA